MFDCLIIKIVADLYFGPTALLKRTSNQIKSNLFETQNTK